MLAVGLATAAAAAVAEVRRRALTGTRQLCSSTGDRCKAVFIGDVEGSVTAVDAFPRGRAAWSPLLQLLSLLRGEHSPRPDVELMTAGDATEGVKLRLKWPLPSPRGGGGGGSGRTAEAEGGDEAVGRTGRGCTRADCGRCTGDRAGDRDRTETGWSGGVVPRGTLMDVTTSSCGH